MDGQVKLLKRAEKDKVEQEVIRADFVRPVLWLPSASRTQVALEDELGACIPTVFKGNIVYIVRNSVLPVLIVRSSSTNAFSCSWARVVCESEWCKEMLLMMRVWM